MKIPYERLVQWLAGPVSVLAGWVATKLVTHTSFLGQVGLGRSAVAHAITASVTFVVGAGLTYAAHHKWLDNLSYWWRHLEELASANVGTADQGPEAADQ